MNAAPGAGPGGAAPGTPARPPDLRLVPTALAAWAVVLLGLHTGPVGSLVAAGLAGCVLLAGLRRRAAVLVAAAGCALAASLVVAAHTQALQAHPLRLAAERGAAATLTVVVRDDPRALRAGTAGGRPGAAQVLVPATVRAAQTGGGRWTGGGRVLLIAPAAGWSALLPGQEVGAAGLLAPATRADLTVAVLRVRGVPQAPRPAPWWQVGAGTLRDGLRAAATAVLPEAPAGLLPGLAVGDTRGLPEEVVDDFRTAGLSHLLAVSGSNLAIVAGAVLGLLRFLRADPRLSAVLSGAALVGFVVLARPSPSVLRAAVMGGVVLLAIGLGRARSAVPALAATVLALLLVDPALATDPGFGLSVLATGALVLVVPGWVVRLRERGVPPGVAEALAVPAAACLVTAPLVAGLSGGVSLVAVAANLLAAPAVAPATVLGVAAAVLSPVSAAAAQWCAWLAGPAVRWLVAVADRAAAVPGGVVPWPRASPGRGCSPRWCSRSWRWPAPGGSARCSSRRSSACSWCSSPPGCCAPAGRRRAGRSWRATSGRATRWCSRPGRRGGPCWSTRGPATDRSTPACAGSASPRSRSCWSATCTPTTSAACRGHCAAVRSGRSPSGRSGSRRGRWNGSPGRRPRPARARSRSSPASGWCGPPSPSTSSARSTRPRTSTRTTARRSTTARSWCGRRPRRAPCCFPATPRSPRRRSCLPRARRCSRTC